MMRQGWEAEGIDVSKPSLARIYDYLLGGSHNFAVDRASAREMVAVMPDIRLVAQANRAFLHRAVRFMVDQGVRQFLDIGSGVPTVGNVHDIAQRAAPQARVVYVDIDPVAVAHSEQILVGNAQATIIEEDLRRPEDILGNPETQALIDFDEPVGLLLVAILHVIPDEDDPAGIVGRLRDELSPGSYLAIGHPTADSRTAEMEELIRLSQRSTTPGAVRMHAQISRFFAGFDLVEPGVVWAAQWRPESPEDVGDDPERSSIYVGVGRKP
jgi:SAM-dependent methyltransferase